MLEPKMSAIIYVALLTFVIQSVNQAPIYLSVCQYVRMYVCMYVWWLTGET